MTWAKTWENILQGGPTRWKVDDLEMKKRALARIHEFVSSSVLGDSDESAKRPLKILCPLAGDDPFVQYA